MDDYVVTSVPCVGNVVDPVLVTLNMRDIEQYKRTDDYVFRSKKGAETLCQMLKEYDKKRLEEFNKTYGTDHKYPF